MTDHDVPPGKLRVTVTYLEMGAPPARSSHPAPMERLALLRAEDCTVAFYRFLYGTVGEPWLWWFRRTLSDEALAAIVRDPAVAIYVPYVRGVPAGYVELDRRTPDECAIAYFGLMPDFIGRGIGPWLLDWAVQAGWSEEGTKRLTVNTCNLDHPKALMVYQRAGFVPVRQDVKFEDDPRLTGVIRRGAARHIPLAVP